MSSTPQSSGVSTRAVVTPTISKTTRRSSWLCVTWKIREWSGLTPRGRGGRNNLTKTWLNLYSQSIAKIITSSISKASMRLSRHLCIWCKRHRKWPKLIMKRKKGHNNRLMYDSCTTASLGLCIDTWQISMRKRSFFRCKLLWRFYSCCTSIMTLRQLYIW